MLGAEIQSPTGLLLLVLVLNYRSINGDNMLKFLATRHDRVNSRHCDCVTYRISLCNFLFSRYARARPISCTFLQMAWLKWKVHPFMVASGYSCLRASQTAASKSTMKAATTGGLGKTCRMTEHLVQHTAQCFKEVLRHRSIVQLHLSH